MKSKGQIIHKVKQVRFRYLKKFIDKCLSQTSSNCLHNRPTLIAQSDVDKVCLCGFQMEEKGWVGKVCDKRLNPELAKGCSIFEPLKSKEELKSEFNSSLEVLPIPVLASKFPDLAALLWVLEEDVEEKDDG